MELKPVMRDDRSSRREPVRLTNFHIAATSFAALGGLALATWQALGPQSGTHVTVALEAPRIAESIDTAAVDLAKNASFTAALKDGADQRYALAKLFDGDPRTFVTLTPPDGELNVQVNFGAINPGTVTAIEYAPPPNADPSSLATTVDLMVLPDGQLEASGRPVMSFSLKRSSGSQTLAVPGNARGRGLWLRIAGPPGASGTVIGDFRVLQEGIVSN